MAGRFPPDTLLFRYEDLLSEKNSLVGRVKALESQLKRVYAVPEPSQASSTEQNEPDALLQSFGRSDVFCPRTACDPPPNLQSTGGGGAVIQSAVGRVKENLDINTDNTTHTSGSTGGSSQSGWSAYETCVSTSTIGWDGEPNVSKDLLSQECLSRDSSRDRGEQSCTMQQPSAFMTGSKESGEKSQGDVVRARRRPKRGPLHVRLPRDDPEKRDPDGFLSSYSPMSRLSTSPGFSPDRATGAKGGMFLDPEEYLCAEDAPSRLQSMSAGQISAICSTCEFPPECLRSTEICSGKSGRSAGVSEGPKRKPSTFCTKSEIPCSTPKSLLGSGTFMEDKWGHRNSATMGHFSEISSSYAGSVSPRLSLNDLCQQMMKGIDDMKQVSQDVCRRTGITTDTETGSTTELDRASTLPLSSTTSVNLLSSSDNVDLESAANQSSQDSSPPPPGDVHTNTAHEKLASERLRKLWTGPSSLPTPLDNPSALFHDAQPFRPARSVLRRKSDPVKVPQSGIVEKLSRSSMCTEQKCLLAAKCPSCCDASLRHTPEPQHYSQTESQDRDSKEETKRMYENPLSSSRLGHLSPSSGDTGDYKPFALDLEDQRDQQDPQMESRRYEMWDLGTTHQGEPCASGSKSKIPCPSQDQFSTGTQDNPVQQKDAAFQSFRNTCDAVYKTGNTVSTNDVVTSGCRSTAGPDSTPKHGSKDQDHVTSMMEKVRQKVDSEGPPRNLLSPVSEENSARSSLAGVMKDPPSDEPKASLRKKKRRHSLFYEKPPEVKGKGKHFEAGARGYQSSSGSSSFGKIEITSDINREKTLHHVAQESTISQMDRCFSSAHRGNRVTLSRRGRIAASQTYGAVTDFVVSQAIVSKGRTQFDIHCDRLDGWAFVGIVSSDDVKTGRRPRGLAECHSSFGWTNDSEFFEHGSYHFEALRELISPGANFQISIDCVKGVVAFRLARPSRSGAHRCHKRYLVCELEDIPKQEWRLVIEWLGTARFELLDVKRWP